MSEALPQVARSTLQPQAPMVAILLCTYQAQRFLADQLQSIQAQTWPSWKLWVSDDGSKDRTLEILQSHRERWGDERLHVQPGPCRGSTANFLSLACHQVVDAPYFAFCDQDDLWHPDKLERALQWLQAVPADTPALYCSRTVLVDEHNQTIGQSHLFTHPPGFRNALVQSIAGGNTMVFNRAARALLLSAGVTLTGVVAAINEWGGSITGLKPMLDTARSLLVDTLGVPPGAILPLVMIGAGAMVSYWRRRQRMEGRA